MVTKKIRELQKKLQGNECIFLDGATGTEIQRRDGKTTLPLWPAGCLLQNPSLVEEIHDDYIASGADIITTNTFRTTTRTLRKAKIGQQKAKELTILACKLIKDVISRAKSKKNIYIAGSIAPLEDCYSPQLTPANKELIEEHRELAKNLKVGGVDFILIETMITIRETLAAIKASLAVGLPFGISFCCDKYGNLLGKETLEEALKAIEKFRPLFVGVNCMPPQDMNNSIKKLRKLTHLPISVYAHGKGHPDDRDGWIFEKGVSEDAYVRYAKKWVSNGAQIIGGCCGTTPQYIKKISLGL